MTRSGVALALALSAVGIGLVGCAAQAEIEEQPAAAPTVINSRDALVLLADCLRGKGWEIELEGGAIVREGPPEQSGPYRDASVACESELGFDDIEAPEVNEGFAVEQYERQVELRECLLAEGYSPPELPSQAVYVDQLLLDGTVYSLYSELGTSYDDLIFNTCPDPLDTWGS